ncbi:MAG TPA: ABC transporter permease [Candidatus Dormibacteraeota bacterium]|nr:ABC transporter permease [Candidatus Dormibacteraeota bacterium]
MTIVNRFTSAVLTVYFWAFIGFLFAPLAVIIVFAFNQSAVPVLPINALSTRWFQRAFDDTELTGAVLRSAEIGAATGLFATALGIMASLGLSAHRLRLRAVFVAILLLPLVVPYISLAVGLLLLLNQLGLEISLGGVFLGHVVIALPFSILVVLPRLRSLDPALIEAARDLGAGQISAFNLVTLPLLLPSLVSSFLICFVTSFDEFAIASFLAPPGLPTYPVFLYSGSRTPGLLPELIAIGSLIIVGSLAIVVLAEGGRRWAERRLQGATVAAADEPAAEDVGRLAAGA